jgi:hypothetical protein
MAIQESEDRIQEPAGEIWFLVLDPLSFDSWAATTISLCSPAAPW